MTLEKIGFVDTPGYLLKSGSNAIFPTIHPDDPESHCICIYGFSDKPIYDKFIASAKQPLTPYPLVQGHLVKRLAEAETDSDHARLAVVILDAASSEAPTLSAATVATVLCAQKEKAKQVPIEFRLVFDPGTNSYRFKNDGKPLPRTTPGNVVSNS